jgi:hypothetical protein
MAINFPATPTLNQTYTFNGRTWTYNGVGWQATGASGLSVYTKTDFTATAAQTTFSVTYTVGFVDVYYNGSKLSSSEYTATNGTSVVLGTACAVNDIVETVAWTVSTTLNPALGVATATSLAIGGATIGSNALAVTGSSSFPGSTNITAAGLVGIGMTPSNVLDITQSVNGPSKINLLNNSAGTAVYASMEVNNGTSSGAFAQFGAGYTPSAVYRANGTYLASRGAGGLTINTEGAYPIYFGIGSVEKMRLDASGILGIGITPSSWGTFNAAQVGLLSLASYTNGDTDISSNLYYNAGWKYIGTGRSAQIQLDSSTSGGNIVFTTDATGGTAGGASSATEKMRITAAGNLGIGMTPSNRLDITQTTNGFAGAQITNSSAGASAYTGYQLNNGSITGGIFLAGTGNADPNFVVVSSNSGGSVSIQPSGGSGITQFKSNGSESARIDASGSLLVGTTDQDANVGGASGAVCWVFRAGYGIRSSINTDSHYWNRYATGTLHAFRYDGTDVGSISVGASSTGFNTSSDARLKTNVSDAAPASALIDAIQVRQFDWKVDNSHQRYGMVAQELLEVAPEAVSVPADPEQMMGVDYSKLVPMLIKEVQSLRTRLAALESK